LSDEEAILITGAATLTDAVTILLEKTDGVFAITLGKEGTLLGFNNTTVTIPSIAIKPVDTTGAGDAFVGAVLYQLSDKTFTQIKAMSETHWKEIVTNANKAGARTCEYMGAMEAFKHLNNSIFK
jgi:fructokinase